MPPKKIRVQLYTPPRRPAEKPVRDRKGVVVGHTLVADHPRGLSKHPRALPR